MTNRPDRSGSCILAGLALATMLACLMSSASAQEIRHESNKRMADASASVSTDAAPRSAPQVMRRGLARTEKGPYYVDFRARTAASWGHAFVWYGKTSEKAVEVAGLTPAGDTWTYVLGYFTWVPSETGASYGDLDPDYLTANYRVYLNEADAKRVFAYIKKLQASSPVWNAETTNCTGFIGDIAEYMGLKVPNRWQRPENFVNSLKEMNGGRQVVRLSAE
ncbi:hypothetical protein [Bradyrhizobium guangdongense]|uniref:DUF4105 domain-containing protein n=2 Tax=Bradyrhizobium guangdongense TaxID=1325090 RepID=A0ABX6UKU6_9BRAD|nr:hypothetical protein [Bradyrhizobium guangdongense]QAU40621.1 hypothetical protein X265_25285 [Bradyrhizobium guangdongense]QOZ61682.1 hypothetical protein XH86_25310 [Bradyrhizobium guangdongense]